MTKPEPSVPATDWAVVGPVGHAVQFYERDGDLLDLLSRFIGTAVIAGDASVVAATKAHRDGLASRLKMRGLDLAVPRKQGRLVMLDAEATLAKILKDGRPDAARFTAVFAPLFERFRARGRCRVAVFGELVAVLWAQGKHASAIALEEMWNDLAEQHEFSLCCAYPIKGFGNGHAAPFMKICAQHSHVFSATRPASL